MAEEEVVVAEASPVPSDHKRKLEDLEPQSPNQTEPTSDEPEKSNGERDAAASDEAEAKRPRLDEKPDGSASENGHQEEKVDESVKDNNDQPVCESSGSEEAQPQTDGTEEKVTDDQQPSVDTQQPPLQESDDAHEPSNEESQPQSSEGHQQEDAPAQQDQPTSDNETITRKVEVPNNKVGVLIGKAGDTIRYLQYNSGAKIQITRDAEADPYAATRLVEIIGTLDNINKAEKLINAVIAEADAGGSPSLVARGLAASQAAAVTEQIEIQVPNEKVGLIIGRGGETIKGLQARSGARIQVLIPQHLPQGDESKERTVRVSGDKRQIETAREMIKEVMNQTVRQSSFSGGFNQQGYRPRGPSGPPQWGPRGGHVPHQNSYDYHQRGPYPSHNPQFPPSYGGYPQQMGPRSSFSSGWEQRPPPSMHGMPQHGSYDYYGQKGPLSDAHRSAQHSALLPPHVPGPSPNPTMAPPQSQANYNYGQHQGPDYGHPGPYSQAAHAQQSYGHGYDDHTPAQHHYGSSQPYPQSGAPAGYGQQQQYSKSPYSMPSQGPPPQTYGPPRPSQQPGDVPYQGSVPAQSYGQSVPPQQPYPYASSGPTQQAYAPYGSAPAAEGYNQPAPATSSGYPQQGGQPVASYGQSASQQAAGYPQVGHTAGYGQYPSAQQGYAEQSAPTTASYGYQAPQDPSYGAAPASAYGAPPTAQAGYAAQPAQAQQSYDQSAQQAGAYGVQPSTSVAYGKTQSPQPGYAQYDSAQMYAAPH